MAFLRNAVFALLTVCAVLTTTCHGGEYVVLRAPPSVKFDSESSEPLPLSNIPLIVLAAFGYGPRPEMQWTGLYQVSPFHTVKAAVLFSVVTYPGSPLDGMFADDLVPRDAVRFQTVQDLDEVGIDEVVDALAQRKSSLFLDARLNYDGNIEVFSDVNGPFANISRHNISADAGEDGNPLADQGDNELAVELGIIRFVLNTLKNHRRHVERATQDFYHFRLEGLAKLSKLHGPHSEEFTWGLRQAQHFLRQAADEFLSIYNGNAIIQLVTTTETSETPVNLPAGVASRQNRQLLQAVDTNLTLSLNLAPYFNWLYPEMFNIALWFTIVFTLIVFFVSWCMWFIDPGYDSVIYRLTTPQKMKGE